MITFGSPVDTRVALPLGIPEEVAESAAGVLAGVFGRTAVPAWMSRTGFRLLDPVKSLRQQVDFVRQLHDREALLPRERQRRFLMGEGWVAWPGPGARRLHAPVHRPQPDAPGRVRDRGPHRDPGRHRLPGADRRRRGRRDRPGAGGAGDHPRRAAAPTSTSWRYAPGTSASSSARRRRRPPGRPSPTGRTGGPARASCPRGLRRVGEDEPEPEPPSVGTRLGVGLELAAGVGGGLARSMAGAASRTVGGIKVFAEEVTGQLPRLARLGRLEPHTRVSLGLLLDEQRRATTPRPTSSCSRIAPTPTRRSSGGSTTSFAGCCRSECARVSTSAC